jgi:hypothetical protein
MRGTPATDLLPLLLQHLLHPLVVRVQPLKQRGRRGHAARVGARVAAATLLGMGGRGCEDGGGEGSRTAGGGVEEHCVRLLGGISETRGHLPPPPPR